MVQHLASTGIQAATFNPDATITQLQGLALGVAVLALFILTVVALLGPARQGNMKKSFNISGATLIALFPLFIALVGISVFAASFFGWF